jgi:hypothetical protein
VVELAMTGDIRGSNNGAGQDANSVRDPQVCGKLFELGSEILVIGARDG